MNREHNRLRNRPLHSRLISMPPKVATTLLYLLFVAASTVGADDTSTSIHEPPPPDDRTFRRDIQLRYRDPLRKSQLSQADKDLIAKAAHYLVAELIDPEEKFARGSNRRRILQDLRGRNTSEAGRQFLLEQLAFRCGQLLNEPRGEHKVQGPLLLRELNTSFSTDRGVPDVPFVGGYKAMLKAFELDDKFSDSKANAAYGLGRILHHGEPALTIRVEIAEALAGEIKKLVAIRDAQERGLDVGRAWFLWEATTALGYCQRIADLETTPEFPDALMAVLANDKLDWLARARAAHALSYLPFDASSDLSVINFETARMVRDMALAYNSQPNQWPLWRRVATRVYLTYEARTPQERNKQIGLMYQVNRAGLSQHQQKIKEARDLIMPIVNTLEKEPLTRPKLNQDDIDKLSEWVKNNDPNTRKITPRSQEIRRTAPQDPMANNNANPPTTT